MPHPVENIMRSTLEQLQQIVDVETILGEPVAAGKDALVLPVSKVSLGFLSGGGEYGARPSAQPVKRSAEMMDPAQERYPFAGTAVGGMSISPAGFLCVSDAGIRMVSVEAPGTLDRLIDRLPELINLISNLCKGEAENTDEEA